MRSKNNSNIFRTKRIDESETKKNSAVKKAIRLKKNKAVLLSVVAVSVVFVFVILYLLSPKIILNQDKVIVLNYGEKYVEYGSKGKHLGKDVTDEIKVSGKIDSNKVGKYTITYQLKVSFWNVKKERTVKIVDEKKPTLTLMGDKQVTVCPGKKYQEEGYQAVDEYDGDLTEQVKIAEKKDKLIYSVKDSSDNKEEVIRSVIYEDNEKPVITLGGSETIYHQLDTSFQEPGYTVSDNCDDDLTKQVKVSGKVDVTKEGIYTLTYTVEDEANNKTEVKRVVKVSKKVDINSGVTRKGVIYLTFDDGPSNLTTGKILDILKEENVKATFFVTNSGPDSLIRREYEEGHTVALHTATHQYPKVYASVDNYFADLKEISDRVERITGEKSRIIRFPGGSNNTVSKKYSSGIMTILADEVLNRGYRYYDWNIDSGDAWQCVKNNVSDKSRCVYHNVVSNLSNNKANIVLMHDIKTHTVDALRNIIRYGKDNGYTFSAIDMNTAMIVFKVNN
ncbi:MAG: polysaccharide deacetylase family protein [bacterium]|nr:polysaccharide deacetylase family protein [bacterium]